MRTCIFSVYFSLIIFQYREYKVKKIRLRFCDSMGLEGGDDGIKATDIAKIMDGHVMNGSDVSQNNLCYHLLPFLAVVKRRPCSRERRLQQQPYRQRQDALCGACHERHDSFYNG